MAKVVRPPQLRKARLPNQRFELPRKAVGMDRPAQLVAKDKIQAISTPPGTETLALGILLSPVSAQGVDRLPIQRQAAARLLS